MPTVLRKNGYRFYFFSNEGAEPMHIHISKANANGKMWLEPLPDPAYFYGFTAKEIKEIKRIAEENIELFKAAWNEYFAK